MKTTYSLLLVLAYAVSHVHSGCSDIKLEDRIDCVQHENWTPESCVAKGCCYNQTTGFPSCFYSFGNKHEPRCNVANKRDCGNADTTEIGCIKSGCCWQMNGGGANCYFAEEPQTQPTEPPTEPTEPTEPPTEPPTEGPTESPGTGTPTTDAPPNNDWKGRGAKVAFVEVEAEHAHTNGKVIGNDRHYGVLSSEASGRRAVTLSAVGQYVEFTMPIQANSVVIRYSIPDTAGGKEQSVRDAPIDLYVGGKKLKELVFTSKFSWYYGAYPFQNSPGQNPHHFYDEVRTLLDKTYPSGTKVKVQVSSTSQSPTFTIDLADFELVGPPKGKPSGAISVTDSTYGADPTGKKDSTQAFQKAVDDGKNNKKTVYIPEGDYLITDHIIVDQVEVVGAGPWHTVLGGRNPGDKRKSAGIFGKYDQDVPGGSKNVHIRDLAIIGDIRERDDNAPTNALGGSFTDSVVDNVWLQHVKCGGWFDGKMNNFTLKNSRISDTTADGVNFHKGVTNSRVENTFVRNTGDDGLAMWGEQYPNVNNKFVHNTVSLPILANNIAIYGGKDIEVSDNLVFDTITNGGGIHVSNRYANVRGETGIKGDYKIHRNTMVRAGNSDFNWHFGIGAIWFSGLNEEIHANIHVLDCDIIDASYSAISYVEGKVYGVVFENLFINGTGTFVLQLQSTGGEATFKNVKAINVQQKNPIYNQLCKEPFKITAEGTKTGWYTDKPDCGDDSYIKAVVPKWPWIW